MPSQAIGAQQFGCNSLFQFPCRTVNIGLEIGVAFLDGETIVQEDVGDLFLGQNLFRHLIGIFHDRDVRTQRSCGKSEALGRIVGGYFQLSTS